MKQIHHEMKWKLTLMKNKKRAFTLIELLVAITLFSILAVSLYSHLYLGSKIWKRSKNNLKNTQSRHYLFNKIEQAFQKSVNFSFIQFVGEAHQIYFCQMNNSNDELGSLLVKTQYQFDPENPTGLHIKNYDLASAISLEEQAPKNEKTYSQIKNFNLTYAYYNSKEKKVDWHPIWIKENQIPMFIQIEWEYIFQNKMYQKIQNIYLPCGELVPFQEEDSINNEIFFEDDVDDEE